MLRNCWPLQILSLVSLILTAFCLRICHSIWKTALLLNVQVAQQNMMIHKIAQNWTKTRQLTLFCAWIALQVEPHSNKCLNYYADISFLLIPDASWSYISTFAKDTLSNFYKWGYIFDRVKMLLLSTWKAFSMSSFYLPKWVLKIFHNYT